jgi:hypothetical protein
MARGLQHALHHHFLDLGNRLGRVQPFGAGFGAIHDRVAAIQLERIMQIIQPLACGLVAAVDDPAIGMQQRCRAKVAIAIPPVAGARGRAAGAHHAFIKPVQLLPILNGLLPFFRGRVGFCFQPRIDRGMLRVEMA